MVDPKSLALEELLFSPCVHPATPQDHSKAPLWAFRGAISALLDGIALCYCRVPALRRDVACSGDADLDLCCGTISIQHVSSDTELLHTTYEVFGPALSVPVVGSLPAYALMEESSTSIFPSALE